MGTILEKIEHCAFCVLLGFHITSFNIVGQAILPFRLNKPMRMIAFTEHEHKNLCIAGINRRPGCATGYTYSNTRKINPIINPTLHFLILISYGQTLQFFNLSRKQIQILTVSECPTCCIKFDSGLNASKD